MSKLGTKISICASEHEGKAYQHKGHTNTSFDPHKMYSKANVYESGWHDSHCQRKLWLIVVHVNKIVDNDKPYNEKKLKLQDDEVHLILINA